LQGCPPTQTHEETVTIKPSNFRTFSEVNAGGADLCTGGTAADIPGPNRIITGFFHRYNSDSGCYVNQIYEGALRFQIDAAPFNRRLIKSATLTMNIDRINATPARNSCIDKMGFTDLRWWALPDMGRIHINDLQNIQTIPHASPLTIDVTPIVTRWANGTADNNGFIFVGQRPEMSNFSNEGMLTNETCEAFYGNMSLTVTFFQFNNPAHTPSIAVHAVHTQTTTDITVEGTDFTPGGSVQIFADDVPGRMGSFPLGSTTADSQGKFQFFNRSLCTKQPDSATIRALDNASGDNARGFATVFCS
ncbi:MAG TPA: hypothetical protein VLH77_00730, partial [Gammaproteobacteria bacterium]|nr:hypothetical protein [Gammaproteobacteria bacterium]